MPRPTANKMPPARQRITFTNMEPRGVIIDTIIKSSIPPPRDPQIASHAYCFAATLISVKMETNTSIRNTLASIHIAILPAFSP